MIIFQYFDLLLCLFKQQLQALVNNYEIEYEPD